MKMPITSEKVLDTRKKLDINQQQFWSRLSVTQSGGSRYESGRDIPIAVQRCIVIAYGTEAEAASIVASLRKPMSAKK